MGSDIKQSLAAAEKLLKAGKTAEAIAEFDRVVDGSKGDLLTVNRVGDAIVSAGNGAVKHGPVYFEDPFEETGGDDRSFAWTGEDYWHSLYGPSRFLVSAVLFPVSAALTPPWQVMESDGQPGRRVFGMEHDAEP